MSNKIHDLRLVLTAIDTTGLLSLRKAFDLGLVCRGCFVDGDGNGCLINWLSEQEVYTRPSRQLWERHHPFFGKEHLAAIKRIVVGWDASDPKALCAAPGYDKEYPPAEYVLTEADVLAVLEETLSQRPDHEETAESRILTTVDAPQQEELALA